MNQQAIEKVLNTVEITDSCWNWKGAIGKNGYGALTFKNKFYTAHRFSYAFFKGDPAGKFVCHKCDNRRCVNPDHLFLGTNQDNIDDAKNKGRKLGRSKALATEQVNKIIELLNEGYSTRAIAAKIGTSASTVSRISLNRY